MKREFLILISMILILSVFTGCSQPPNVPQGNVSISGIARYFDKAAGQHGGIKVTLISQQAIVNPGETPQETTPPVKYTDANGHYAFENIASGNYLIIAEDPNNVYYPATTVLSVGENETKTAEDLVLTKAIKHVVIFREDESGWATAGIPSTVIGDILQSEIEMAEGTGANQYEYRSLRGTPNLNLNIGDLIIIEGDQPQDFYDTYTANQNVFDTFVYNGGTIFWVASDWGWAEGDFTSTLPGGVTWGDYYDYYNDILNFEHPITKNFPAQLYGNYASHGGFDNLDAGLPITNIMIYLRETSSDEKFPTYIEYRYGAGRVLATTIPLEWYVVKGPGGIPEGYSTTYKDLFKLMLVRSIRYIMNLPVSPDIPPSVVTAPAVKNLAPNMGVSSHR
ncbi:MAG TPA: carboxypeptidase regulatory-like domain-containing protein [Dictyoglomaceae bacterium]|nr:carboxypeptidase regulatory-like domain-containing protein [Dictyoglomaceae bacterium]